VGHPNPWLPVILALSGAVVVPIAMVEVRACYNGRFNFFQPGPGIPGTGRRAASRRQIPARKLLGRLHRLSCLLNRIVLLLAKFKQTIEL
jgi:hypothetical protein